MAKAETTTGRAPRGTKPVSQAFFTALEDYGQFRIPEMYAVLAVVFALAGIGNSPFGRIRPRGVHVPS